MADYLNFLDYQMVNGYQSLLIKPGESLNIIYKISRREVLKYKKNKKAVYLESPYLKAVQQSERLLLRHLGGDGQPNLQRG